MWLIELILDFLSGDVIDGVEPKSVRVLKEAEADEKHGNCSLRQRRKMLSTLDRALEYEGDWFQEQYGERAAVQVVRLNVALGNGEGPA